MKELNVKVSDLALGDVVEAFDGPWSSAVVKRITGDSVELFRPYGVSEDFEYTGGVICYIGLETFPVWKTQTITRLQKAEQKR